MKRREYVLKQFDGITKFKQIYKSRAHPYTKQPYKKISVKMSQSQQSQQHNYNNNKDEHSSSQNHPVADSNSEEYKQKHHSELQNQHQSQSKSKQGQRHDFDREHNEIQYHDDHQRDNRDGEKPMRGKVFGKDSIAKDNQVQMPFIFESYTRDDRQKQRSNKPKLGLKRLTEDKKLVSVDIDIPIDQNVVIKDKFDWDLSKDKISPKQFAKQLVTSLKLPAQYIDKIKQQILSQIMQHIKQNTCQKQEQRETFMNDEQVNFNRNNMRFNFAQYPEDDLLEKQENEKKKMSRMRRNQMKRTTTYLPTQPNRYFKEKRMCRNCKNQNNVPCFQCKNCKLPFQLMQSLNFDDKRVKISAKYYEKIANKIPLLTYQAKKKNFEKQDFQSFYAIYHKLKGIFEASQQLTKQSLNQVRYIMQKYHEYFLNGNLDFNDEQIIYDKDMKKGEKKEEDVKIRRARGRPRKIKIINDDLIPNSNPNSEQQSSLSQSSSEEDSSS